MTRLRYIAHFVAALACLCLPRHFSAADDLAFKAISPGIEYANVRLNIENGGTTTFDVVRVDLTLANISVVDTYEQLSQRGGYFGYTLRGLASGEKKSLVFMNGGPSRSNTEPIPAGLIIHDSRVSSEADSRDSRLSGILCISLGRARIIKTENLARERIREDCIGAIQAGPRLVEGSSKIVKKLPSDGLYARSVVGIDAKGRVLLIHTNQIRLFDLAPILASTALGFRCVSALNLSGDAQSGFIFRSAGKQVTRGTIDAVIPSALVVAPK
jgi:hypothetical protein